jgi:hypothetical protein
LIKAFSLNSAKSIVRYVRQGWSELTERILNSAMPRRADVMLSSEHAETQQGGVLDGIDHYQLPQSTVTRIAKSAVSETSPQTTSDQY